MNFDFDSSTYTRYLSLVLDIRGSFGTTYNTVNDLIDARGVYLISRVQEGVNRTTCNVLSAKISSRS